MNRKRRWVLVLAIVVAGYCALLLVEMRGPGINKASFDRIQVGMTGVEVEEILGCKAADYSTGGLLADEGEETDEEVCVYVWDLRNFEPRFKEWTSNRAIIHVEFDDDGIVRDKWFLAVRCKDNWLRRLFKLVAP